MRYQRNGWTLFLLGVVVLSGGVGMAQDLESDLPEDVTVITSEKLTFDYRQRYALFERNVLVVDPSMRLQSDQLTVNFDASNKVKEIVAEGNVYIQQEDKIALSGKATYDVDSGKILLTENPRVRRGKDVLQGERITFFRDENKMICEPRARLVIFPEKGGARTQLLGE
jgi:lipopolysaccharide export system protein LptA